MINIRVKQNGHEWTVFSNHDRETAKLLRDMYEDSGDYDDVWLEYYGETLEDSGGET